MKNNKLKTVMNVFVIVLLFLLVFSTVSQAAGSKPTSTSGLNDWIEQGIKFIEDGQGGETKIDANSLSNAIIPIGKALVLIGTVVLVVITVVMGIKYMMCDSAEQKAKLKTQLIGLAVSTIVIFGAQVIWATIGNFMDKLTK